ncbi:MAG: hypothetical protein R3241_09740 [Rheinheimera sp.]|nr:hypothetical protein [Rheinheimera sp.]
MKYIAIAAAGLFLTSCASTNYADYELSTANLSNLQVNETFDSQLRKHQLDLVFDYTINGFHQKGDLYSCTVQFLNNNGTTSSLSMGTKAPCQLDVQSGNISLSWPTLLDKSVISSSAELDKLAYPMQFFVAIHQKTGRRSNKIIGKSAIVQSVAKL